MIKKLISITILLSTYTLATEQCEYKGLCFDKKHHQTQWETSFLPDLTAIQYSISDHIYDYRCNKEHLRIIKRGCDGNTTE